MAATREKGPRFFIGFGFNPQSELHQLYQKVNAELLEHCGIEPLSRTHSPHLTVFPPPHPPRAGCVEEAAERLLSVGPRLPPLTVRINGWGWFGSEASEFSNLHLKIGESRDFQSVFRRLVRVMDGLLVPNEPYVPHISFVRWLSSADRVKVSRYIGSREPSIPFTHLVLDELALFAKHNRGYRMHTRVQLPRS
ncbi:MAG: 2'-5' RNA ligase family protein [bacterium]|nr:2'-5' RNA ligase family protein [bacterium]